MNKEKIGFIGLGKLGLPVAMSITSKGFEVSGYDINADVESYIKNKKIPYQEVRMDELFENNTVLFSSMRDVIQTSDIIFVPVI